MLVKTGSNYSLSKKLSSSFTKASYCSKNTLLYGSSRSECSFSLRYSAAAPADEYMAYIREKYPWVFDVHGMRSEMYYMPQISPLAPAPVQQKRPTPPTPPKSGDDKPQQKKNHTPLIVGLIFALIVCGVCFYFYNNAKTSKEEEAYEFAMKSDDPIVLQTYLDNYKDAPEEHIDSITARLDAIKAVNNEWNNAVVSGSKQALLDYLAKHPDSEHKLEAEHKIDSIDWSQAESANTIQALQAYLDSHANGEHVD